MGLICRICKSNNLLKIIDFGNQPIAHRLLNSLQDNELAYPLALHCCQECGLVQICEPIDPLLLYRDYNYCFSSWKNEPHMTDEIEILFNHTKNNTFFEIGCNDGKFLNMLRKGGANTLVGVEPNPIAGQIAKDKGFHVYSDIFNKKICIEAVDKFGKFEVVIARQVLEHVLDIEDFFKCVDSIISDNGFLFVDVPDFETALDMGDCSVIWEEHVNYFTESIIKNTLQKYGYQSISTSRYNFSGGTVSILAKRTNKNNGQPINVAIDGNMFNFSKRVTSYEKLLCQTLKRYRENGFSIILYGVGCRACTVNNGLKLDQYIDFAIDDQIERQNKYMPGCKLQINSPEVLKKYSKPILCLLAVNQENESIVKSKMVEITDVHIEFISLFSPNDIWEEIKKVSVAIF